MNTATEDNPEPTAAPGRPSSRERDMLGWFGWMLLFGTIGIFLTAGMRHLFVDWAERDVAHQNHKWMCEQADQLRRGEINCFVNPDPAFVAELVADKDCAAKVRDLYLGGDLSDPRLGRLRELPNLKCIIFLFAENQNALLKRLRGAPGVEELTFDRTWLSHDDMAHIAAFPHLKSLSFDVCELCDGDMRELSRHPTLERLAIQRVTSNKELIGFLRSMPRLHELSLGVCNEDFDASRGSFENALKQALPRCKCRVWDDRR